MIGHSLGAAGGIEAVVQISQIYFIFNYKQMYIKRFVRR